MSPTELRSFLADAGLSQSDLARLLDLTPRAIGLWLSEERTIPGPVNAYVRLFKCLPPSIRQSEMRRLKETKIAMRDGMYAVQYQDQTGTSYGYATVILDNGKIHGADPVGGKYDGDYAYNDATRLAMVHLKATFPPNIPAVFAPAQPFEWSVDMTGNMDPRVERGFIELTTAPLGQKVQAQYQFLRELPAM
jgi:hypothetical protein